jgi:hypothetical protein
MTGHQRGRCLSRDPSDTVEDHIDTYPLDADYFESLSICVATLNFVSVLGLNMHRNQVLMISDRNLDWSLAEF